MVGEQPDGQQNQRNHQRPDGQIATVTLLDFLLFHERLAVLLVEFHTFFYAGGFGGISEMILCLGNTERMGDSAVIHFFSRQDRIQGNYLADLLEHPADEVEEGEGQDDAGDGLLEVPDIEKIINKSN